MTPFRKRKAKAVLVLLVCCLALYTLTLYGVKYDKTLLKYVGLTFVLWCNLVTICWAISTLYERDYTAKILPKGLNKENSND